MNRKGLKPSLVSAETWLKKRRIKLCVYQTLHQNNTGTLTVKGVEGVRLKIQENHTWCWGMCCALPGPALLSSLGLGFIPHPLSPQHHEPTSGIKKRKMKQNKNPLLKQRTWFCSRSCDSQKCYWRFKSLPSLPYLACQVIRPMWSLPSSNSEHYFHSSFSFSVWMSTAALPYFCSPQTHPSVLCSPISPSSSDDAHYWRVPQWKLWVLSAINLSFADSLLLMLPWYNTPQSLGRLLRPRMAHESR